MAEKKKVTAKSTSYNESAISKSEEKRITPSSMAADNAHIEKTLQNTDSNGARKNVRDLETWGNADSFKLICKASSAREGWMKSTKAMEIPMVGCTLQVTTQQRNPDGSYSVAEALTFVPGAKIKEDVKDGKVVNRQLIHL